MLISAFHPTHIGMHKPHHAALLVHSCVVYTGFKSKTGDLEIQAVPHTFTSEYNNLYYQEIAFSIKEHHNTVLKVISEQEEANKRFFKKLHSLDNYLITKQVEHYKYHSVIIQSLIASLQQEMDLANCPDTEITYQDDVQLTLSLPVLFRLSNNAAGYSFMLRNSLLVDQTGAQPSPHSCTILLLEEWRHLYT